MVDIKKILNERCRLVEDMKTFLSQNHGNRYIQVYIKKSVNEWHLNKCRTMNANENDLFQFFTFRD